MIRQQKLFIFQGMNAEMDIGTNKKAFQINLDLKKYGTFAEIGAGQEVARWFFVVVAPQSQEHKCRKDGEIVAAYAVDIRR